MKLMALTAALALAGTAAAAHAVPQDAPAPGAMQTMDDPKGGYQPSTPLFSKPMTPGAKVIFVPNTMTPDQAYPPPPAQESYPICKPGQTDNCMQRGG